ncbi:hypothetical protein N665_0197s0054 [Sinapis alba]|nr:hypothetical protein N665_0197s0054 [Sinapis alba]
MGNISELPEDLLLKILSFVPAKYIVATSLVTKSWRCLWTKVSRLTYVAPYDTDKTNGFVRCFQETLLLHQPRALETLYINVSRCSLGIDIRPWTRTHVLCNLRELEVVAGYTLGYICLPSVFVKGRIKVSVPSTVCHTSLKTLHFNHLKLLNDESIRIILSSCPLLSDLRLEHDVMSKLNIIEMPSLQRLTIVTESIFGPSPNLMGYYIRSLEIRSPSLKYLNIEDLASIFYVRVRIRSPISNFENTSIYCRIVQLELSTYRGVFEDLLIYLLERSINLSVLKINNEFTPLDWWKQPSSVPTCLLSSLETLEWRGYNGSCAEKEVVSYLLKHALCLKTAKLITESSDLFEMMMEGLLDITFQIYLQMITMFIINTLSL